MVSSNEFLTCAVLGAYVLGRTTFGNWIFATGGSVRAARAVQVLARIATPDARRLLEEWAKGAEPAVLTREARKALKP